MSPEKAIESVSEMADEIEIKVERIKESTKLATENWKGLVSVGGARSDHAAALLVNLRPSIQSLSSYLDRVDRRIVEWEKSPFAEEVSQ